MESFAGRVAVVTGGASGIGRALAEAFAREGATVVVADIDAGGAADLAASIEARGGRARAVPTDVSDRGQVHRLADRVYEEFGRAHVLCNNAGVIVWGPVQHATHADWQWVLGVNLWGVIHGVEAFLPRMIAGGEPGHVVNTASMAGLVASQGLGVYNTSKYAVVGLSETLAKDLRAYRIGVSVLCPMGVETRIGRADRHRPAALQNEDDGPTGQPVELIGRTLPPETVATMVLAAIREDRLYVITHAESLEPLRRRFDRLTAAAVRRTP